MTELQLRIRRLTHKAARLRKLGKDTAAIAAELADLRSQRLEERSRPKVAVDTTPVDTTPVDTTPAALNPAD